MRNLYGSIRLTAAALLLVGATLPSHALPVIANGGFESGLAGWTRVDQLGSEGTFAAQTGTASPVNGFSVPPPPGGTTAAMTDAQGPGAHLLYQDFVASAGSGLLRFDLFIANDASAFFAPNTLDFATPTLNQQVRVDIVRPTVDPFTMAGSDILRTLFVSTPGSPLTSGYTTISTYIGDLLAANAGQTLRLRFAETDNVFTLRAGVDNVSIVAAVPEPGSTLLLLAAALPLWLGWRGGRAAVRTRRT
ncbi:hypothetical protein [Piscinibacter koreensis]|uniref:PEP-CTERM protein-sorting domain-containing protein n=1 Tax=Piscinibacter koreensis TaxID=2742824 RepID=A0A7Y6TY68_9BURK|nr:hypothetical protein [Schlegelella koreensis]NUZ07820.1 hypothetical protein [Schlegelella koreensis]